MMLYVSRVMNLKCFLFIFLVNILFACQNENSLLGDRYFEAGDYQAAIEAYNEYLKLKPRHVKSIYNRGRCYQELGQYDRAMVDFNKVVDLDEHNEHALLSIGQEMYRQEDYESAAYFSEKVIVKDRDNAMAHYLKGRANHKQGKVRDALGNYNKAINISPEFGEAYLHRGAVKLYLKQKSGACQDLRKAAKLDVEGAEQALRKNCK